MIRISNWMFLVLACVGSATFSSQLIAQDSSSVSKTKSSRTFAEQLWNYLLSNNYKHWSPAPGNGTGQYLSTHTSMLGIGPSNRRPQTRHGAFVKSYVNRDASTAGLLPIGSIVILENYLADKSLESISVMYKTEGFNPGANDWYWVKFNPDGSVASTPAEINSIEGQTIVDAGGRQRTHASQLKPKATGPSGKSAKLSGRIQSCIQCHRTAQGGDLVFFNDAGTRRASQPTEDN